MDLYGSVIYKYPGGVYHTAQTVFDRLEDENIDVSAEDRYYLYRTTYDIEVMLQPTDKRRSEKLQWTSHHVLLSVYVCSNLPGYAVPLCYISEDDTRKTVESCLSYLTGQRRGVPETDGKVWKRVPVDPGKTRQ